MILSEAELELGDDADGIMVLEHCRSLLVCDSGGAGP